MGIRIICILCENSAILDDPQRQLARAGAWQGRWYHNSWHNVPDSDWYVCPECFYVRAAEAWAKARRGIPQAIRDNTIGRADLRPRRTCSHCGGLLYFDDDCAATNNAGAAPSLKCRICGRRTYLDAKGQPVVLVPLPAPTEQRIQVMHAQGVSNGTIAHRLHCNVELVVQVLAERGS